MSLWKGLEILESEKPKSVRKVLILWPSTGGNARAFRLKESELLEQGVLLIRFNPSSHGKSQGIYDPRIAVSQLTEYVQEKGYDRFPLYGLGHSGGGAALVFANQFLSFHKLFLMSPILDSVESLRYLYQYNRIEEFSRLLLDPSRKDSEEPNKTMLQILAEPSWLDSGGVESLSLPIQNARISVEDLSQFLRNLFLPGFRVLQEDLDTRKTKVTIFLPEEDHWFPKPKTILFAKNTGCHLLEIPAPDHFFSRSFSLVWAKVRYEIFSD